MAASAASRCYPTTKRSRPRSRRPAQSSHFSDDEPDDDAILPEHCGSASARWRDRRRSIQMTALRSKDRL